MNFLDTGYFLLYFCFIKINSLNNPATWTWTGSLHLSRAVTLMRTISTHVTLTGWHGMMGAFHQDPTHTHYTHVHTCVLDLHVTVMLYLQVDDGWITTYYCSQKTSNTNNLSSLLVHISELFYLSCFSCVVYNINLYSYWYITYKHKW